MYQDATTVLVQQLGGGGGSRITTARHVSFFFSLFSHSNPHRFPNLASLTPYTLSYTILCPRRIYLLLGVTNLSERV